MSQIKIREFLQRQESQLLSSKMDVSVAPLLALFVYPYTVDHVTLAALRGADA